LKGRRLRGACRWAQHAEGCRSSSQPTIPILVRYTTPATMPAIRAGNAWRDTSNRTRSRLRHRRPRHRQARRGHPCRFSVRPRRRRPPQLFLRVAYGDDRCQHAHDHASTLCTARNRNVVANSLAGTESSATGRYGRRLIASESVIGDPGEQVGEPSLRAPAVELAVAISVAMITTWSAPRCEIATSPKKIPAPDGHWTRINGEAGSRSGSRARDEQPPSVLSALSQGRSQPAR
jgi:hypothetical protein